MEGGGEIRKIGFEFGLLRNRIPDMRRLMQLTWYDNWDEFLKPLRPRSMQRMSFHNRGVF